jgi:hypothetical protein
MSRGRAIGLALATGAILLAAPRAAEAYEFWTRARSTGEVYELRGFRLIGDELAIPRRRFTQSLSLVIRDIGDLERQRRRNGRTGRGVVVSWQSTLRLEHDFGTFVTARLPSGPTRRQDALDVIPEIDDSTLAFSLLYGHLSIDGLLDGRLAVQLGRIVELDGTGALPIDGVAVRAAVAEHVEVRVSGGLAVRDASPLGLSTYELDGTSGAACREYVEAAGGASQSPGRWELIDRSRSITDKRFTSDFEYCPQREVVMPTAAIAVATRQLGALHGELGYRIARSPTVGLIGEVDRLGTPDLGLYPDERGQAPAWGTNLEQLYATAEGQWRAGAAAIHPRAFVRASVIDAVIDRAELEVAVERGRHRWTPSVARFVPTFDADSIWSVFGAEPSIDVAMDYRYDGKWRAGGALWARRYDGGDSGGSAWAWGGIADAAHAVTRRMDIEARALADAGFGGERLALHGELRWTAGRMRLGGRAAVAWVRGDDVRDAALETRTSGTATATATVRLAGGVAVHTMMEMRSGADEASALRALAILDVALESDR